MFILKCTFTKLRNNDDTCMGFVAQHIHEIVLFCAIFSIGLKEKMPSGERTPKKTTIPKTSGTHTKKTHDSGRFNSGLYDI